MEKSRLLQTQPIIKHYAPYKEKMYEVEIIKYEEKDRIKVRYKKSGYIQTIHGSDLEEKTDLK